MEIFQDEAFPNLEYHLFEVIWWFSALIVVFSINYANFVCQMILIVETDIFMLVLSIFGHI